MEPILKLVDVNKHFGGVIAAGNVSLEVLRGEIHGLIGPNGAGKTTIMNLISGIYTGDSGSIFFDGKEITNTASHNRARMGIGRTFQNPRFLYRSSIRDNLQVGTDLFEQIGFMKSFLGVKTADFTKEVDELLQHTGFKLYWDDDINSIPYGQRKVLEVVRAMLSHPKLMLVDEPAAGLTTQELVHVKTLLEIAAKEYNIGILLIEHQMDLIMEACDNIDVIDFGIIIARGKPDEIASNQAVIEAYLGKEEE